MRIVILPVKSMMMMWIMMVLIAAKKYYFDSYPNTYNWLDYCFLQLSVNFLTLFTPKILCEKFQFGKNLRSLLTRGQCRAVIVVEEEETGETRLYAQFPWESTLSAISMQTTSRFISTEPVLETKPQLATCSNYFQIITAFASLALKRSTIWLSWPWNGGNLEDRSLTFLKLKLTNKLNSAK